MGAIGGLLGLSGGDNGTGQPAPAQTPLIQATDGTQLLNAYGSNQNSLQSQQALLQAIQAQNGLGNQSQVYGQLQGVANGAGPNPAQAMLNQSTGQNVANQAALMAGQRGAGANAGLIARQAGQQGAAIQQNAVGQGATLQANQSLNALGAAGSLANQQAANQIGATTANTQSQQSEQQILQNANAQYNNANVAQQGNVNSINGQLANTGMQGQQKLIGGGLGGIGTALMAQGGVVGGYSAGGTVSGPQSSFGKFLKGWAGGDQASSTSPTGTPANSLSNTDALSNGSDLFAQGIAHQIKGDPNSIGSPTVIDNGTGALDLPAVAPTMADGAMLAAQGGSVGGKLKSGGSVPGQAQVQGNSYKNDTVKAMLSPGEVVITRNVMQSANPAEGAARFVQAILDRKKAGK